MSVIAAYLIPLYRAIDPYGLDSWPGFGKPCWFSSFVQLLAIQFAKRKKSQVQSRLLWSSVLSPWEVTDVIYMEGYVQLIGYEASFLIDWHLENIWTYAVRNEARTMQLGNVRCTWVSMGILLQTFAWCCYKGPTNAGADVWREKKTNKMKKKKLCWVLRSPTGYKECFSKAYLE